jgi:hypothetical protein
MTSDPPSPAAAQPPLRHPFAYYGLLLLIPISVVVVVVVLAAMSALGANATGGCGGG